MWTPSSAPFLSTGLSPHPLVNQGRATVWCLSTAQVMEPHVLCRWPQLVSLQKRQVCWLCWFLPSSESLGRANATPIAAGKKGSLCWCLGQRVQLHEPVPARQEQSSSTNKKFFLLFLSGQKILSQISLRQRLNSALSAYSFNSAFCALFKIVVESTKLVLPLEKINPRITKTGTNKLQQCFVSAQVCSEQDGQSQWGRGVGIKTSFRPSPHLHHQFRVQMPSHNCPCWFAPGTALTYVSPWAPYREQHSQ